MVTIISGIILSLSQIIIKPSANSVKSAIVTKSGRRGSEMTLDKDAMALLSPNQIVEYLKWHMPSSEHIIRDLQRWKRDLNRSWKLLAPGLSYVELVGLAKEIREAHNMINSVIRSERRSLK